MRIGFLGKGGSGKSSISSAFAMYLQEKGKKTFLVDADVNIHTYDLVGLKKEDLKPISRYAKEISDYVKGKRKDFQNLPFISSTPPSKDSNFIYLDEENEIIKKVSIKNNDGLNFMCIGGYEKEDIGFNCYHGKSDAFAMMLNHIIDKNDEYLIIDSVTGVDNISTIFIHSYDVNILVVEPTEKSVSVYKDFMLAIEKMDLDKIFFVVGNKISSKEDEIFLEKNIEKGQILGFVKKSKNLKRFDKGDKKAIKEFIKENEEIFENIFKNINGKQRDLDKYSKNIYNDFKFNVINYYKPYYHIDLTEKIEEKYFNYKEKYLKINKEKC